MKARLILLLVGACALIAGSFHFLGSRIGAERGDESTAESTLQHDGEQESTAIRREPSSGHSDKSSVQEGGLRGIGSAKAVVASRVRIKLMKPEVAALVERFREDMALKYDDEAVYLEALNTEKVDPVWSGRTEQLLANALELRGASLTSMSGLQPRCVRSLCALAMEGGTRSDEPGANLQSALSDIAQDPWFRDNFKDSVLSVGAEDERILYSVYLIRKD